ncbi:MAG: hypothetical protein CMD39_07340 [Gammaproteobacteria bacterium]|mgnify:CR=1 FL=1|nr:hypothetical protein [Gammaproteobacteria bacterium]
MRRLLELLTEIWNELTRIRELLEAPPQRMTDQELCLHFQCSDRHLRDLIRDAGDMAYALPGAPDNIGTKDSPRRRWDPRTAHTWFAAAQQIRASKRCLARDGDKDGGDTGEEKPAAGEPAPMRTTRQPKRRPPPNKRLPKHVSASQAAKEAAARVRPPS